MAAQPSLLRMWQAKFKNSIRQYVNIKAEADGIMAEIDRGGADTALSVEYQAAHDKERLLRGVVRGNASMLLILCRPNEAALKGRQYAEAVHDLEVEYGMPGKKFRRQIEYRGQADKTLLEDNRDSRK